MCKVLRPKTMIYITLISLRLLINIFTFKNCLCARTPNLGEGSGIKTQGGPPSHQILSFQSLDSMEVTHRGFDLSRQHLY